MTVLGPLPQGMVTARYIPYLGAGGAGILVETRSARERTKTFKIVGRK